MGRKANPTVIGAFVVGAIALAVVGAIFFGSGRYFRKTLPAVVYFKSSVSGLQPGAPVKFMGVQVGTVRDIRLSLAPHERAIPDISIPVILDLDKDTITREGARIAPTEQNLRRLVDEGLRAQLSTESLVTGVLYISLDLRPGTPLNLVADKSVSYPEIPTIPTEFEEVQQAATRLAKKLDDVDLKDLVSKATDTLDGLRRILDDPKTQELPASLDRLLGKLDGTAADIQRLAANANGSLLPELRTTLEHAGTTLTEASGTFQNLRSSVEPGGPLVYRLDATLAALTGAASAIENLALELDRNPSSIIRGRYVNKEDGAK
jgi:paraquat-inducible protein B